MRLFFALWPDPDTRRSIEQVARSAVRRAGGRPVPVKDYHITLVFLGQVPAARFEDVVATGRSVTRAWPDAGIEMELDRFGYWPKSRVFWLGPSKNPRVLTSLVAQLQGELTGLDITLDPRPLLPHVTLCRKVRRAPALTVSRPVRWRADGCVLVESVTAPDGAEYKVLERFRGSAFP